ncbi:MAG: hypothetical protein ABI645_15850 [Pseudomonadota bacterium]
MIALGLLLSVVVPLLAGVVWVAPLSAGRAGAWPLSLGYGYVLGLLITVIGIRALDVAHIPINFLTAAILPLISAAIGFWRRRALPQSARVDLASARTTWQMLSKVPRILIVGLVGLIALRLLALGAELLPRPFFPWEAVSAVATKARVWFESGALQQFVPASSWLQGLGIHTDTDPSAFALPSLLLVWTAHAVGQWHEGAVGFPWWMLGLSLALALYGHVRRLGGGIAFALTATYLLISLPLLDVNIALAGAPNWVAAAGIGLAGCAVLAGLTTPSREMAVYFVVGAALALASQASTWPWMAIFAIAFVMERWPRSAVKLFAGIPLLILLFVLALLQTPIRYGGSTWQLKVAPDWLESVESLFLLDNWHLLYGLTLLVLLGGWRTISSPSWLSRTWVVATGLGLMFMLGTLTLPGAWFGGQHQFSITGLQLAPMLVLWLSMAARDIAVARSLPRVDAGQDSITDPSQ